MQPEDRDPAYLLDMVLAGQRCLQYLAALDAGEHPRSLVFAALELQLIFLGEAARRISPAFKTAHPEVPWQDPVSLGNVLVHEYDKVDERRVLGAARLSVTVLLGLLEELVDEPR